MTTETLVVVVIVTVALMIIGYLLRNRRKS